MILTAILNLIFAVGVIVMVLTPLMWAILTQHRDRPRPTAAARTPVRSPEPQPRRPSSQPRHEPVVGRA